MSTHSEKENLKHIHIVLYKQFFFTFGDVNQEKILLFALNKFERKWLFHFIE